MVDPVRALGAVVKLIKEDRFKPDGDRTNFFPEGNPAKPDAPVFQPKTPGNFKMPMTPAMVPHGAIERELLGQEVKEEATAPEGASIPTEEIDLVTTESETSTSGEEFATSEPEAEGELEPSDVNVLNEDADDAWVQHKKTKVIHAIAGAGSLFQGPSMPMVSWFRTERPNVDVWQVPTLLWSQPLRIGPRSAGSVSRASEIPGLSSDDHVLLRKKLVSCTAIDKCQISIITCAIVHMRLST